MAVYTYVCDDCDLVVDIEKPMTQSSSEEFCEQCSKKMWKKYNTFKMHYDRTFEDMDYGSAMLMKKHKEDIEKNKEHIKNVEVPKGTPREFVPNV